MKFTKMEGLGNDYVYVDLFDAAVSLDVSDTSRVTDLAVKMSDRHFGIGADGLILIGPGEKAPFRMTMFNADGSRSAMCGNGLRCVAKYVADAGYVKANGNGNGSGAPDAFDVESDAGLHHVQVVARDASGGVQRVRLAMGAPRLTNAEVPTTGPAAERTVDFPLEVNGETHRITCVSMGNPHAVIFVDDPSSFPVERVGRAIELHPFFPLRTNVEFVKVVSRNELVQRTWERGSGETLACGSGACAVLVAANLVGHTGREATIHLLGGDLTIEWDEKTNQVFKTGPAVTVFAGDWPA
ncbi:MAG: diaminopimelate epimerase [Planctomycetota bacterium]